jgi:hypothetical protein
LGCEHRAFSACCTKAIHYVIKWPWSALCSAFAVSFSTAIDESCERDGTRCHQLENNNARCHRPAFGRLTNIVKTGSVQR